MQSKPDGFSRPKGFCRANLVSSCAALGGKITLIDGPFTEAKEIVGGFSIFTAESKRSGDRGILTTKMMEGSEQDAECEVRQLYDVPAA